MRQSWNGLPLTRLPLTAACRNEIEVKSQLKMLTVAQRDLLPRGLCYWNVDKLVRDFGGSMVVGWQHLWWPGRLAVSTHHAVWRKSDGTLIDVTQKEETDCGEGISFSPDASLKVDLSWPMFVPNVFLQLSEHSLVSRAVLAFDQQIAVAREARDYVKSKNGTFLPGRGLLLPSGQMPVAIARRVQSANKRYRNVLKQCEKLAQHSHPSRLVVGR